MPRVVGVDKKPNSQASRRAEQKPQQSQHFIFEGDTSHLMGYREQKS